MCILRPACLILAAVLGLGQPAAADGTAPQDWTAGLSGLDGAGLDPAALTLLGRNGFVIRPTALPDMEALYAQVSTLGDCTFVTSDAMLHVGHVFFDDLLRILEIDRLSDTALALTDRMLADARAQYAAATDPDLKQAAWLNIGFFAVAKAQFDPAFRPGLGLDEMVGKELAAIEKHGEVAFRELLPYVEPHSLDDTPFAYEDYSQYVPRGHYTRNETFQRYFKAMMWYGRIDFKLLPARADGSPDEYGRRMTLQALLITDALAGDAEALRLWHRIYDPTVFFVGKTDDLTVEDYLALAGEVFPGTGLDRYADTARQSEFMTRARALRPPKILGGPGGKAADNMGFRFMGQRFIPDSHIFQELVFGAAGPDGKGADFHYTGTGAPFTMEDIPNYGLARAFPRGLDVMAVFGSDRALELLRGMGDTDYVDYARQLERLTRLYATTTEAEWQQNLYWRWLGALLPLFDGPSGAPAQDFLATTAWLDKQLQTALGSWTELRHDTILYAKQSYTGMAKAMAMEPPYSYGYVEPVPLVYARLAAMSEVLRQTLDELGMMPEGVRGQLDAFAGMLEQLQRISERELAGEALDQGDYDMLNRFGDLYGMLTRFPAGVMERISSGTDSRMDIVADVHTYIQGGTVLEEGVGAPSSIFVRIRDAAGYRLCRGGVFSYSEFKWPMADRLTDEAWQAMAQAGRRPPRPAWAEALEK